MPLSPIYLYLIYYYFGFKYIKICAMINFFDKKIAC